MTQPEIADQSARVAKLEAEIRRLRADLAVMRSVMDELPDRLAELDAIDTSTRYSYQEQAHFLLTGETAEQRAANAQR